MCHKTKANRTKPNATESPCLFISEFKPQARYYIFFLTNGKDMNPLIPPAMGWILPVLFFFKDDISMKVYMPLNKETETSL